ncbi:MAG: ERF family protein [Vulcanimicrobiaceae bacterium]
MDGLTTSESLAAIGKALAAAQAEMTEITRSRTAKIVARDKAPYSYTYAELAEVLTAVLPALNKHGIAAVQSPGCFDDGQVVVETLLLHESGEWMKSELRMRPTAATPQGTGSAITYARRYALQAMCGVAPEDDDGAAASAPAPKTPMQRSAPLRAVAERKAQESPAEAPVDAPTGDNTPSAASGSHAASNHVETATPGHDGAADAAQDDPTAPLTQVQYEHLKPVVDALPREAVAETLWALTGRVDDFTQLYGVEAHAAYVALRKAQIAIAEAQP